MWMPDEGPTHRAGKTYEPDLSLRYLSPGAFTVLTRQDQGSPPDPPTAPNPNRLTPSGRRSRNQAFAIIAETGSNPGSRSPSPSGRVSPFRGRGFNPTGSRHASPCPTPPPPEDERITLQSPSRSKIPQLDRRGSGTIFGEKVEYDSSPRNLKSTPSKSLTNLGSKHVSYKPPPSPRRKLQSKVPAFQKLSPIIGSSPEPDSHRLKSQSSSTKIPRSRSQPPSSKTSPVVSPNASLLPSRHNSRPSSRNQSRNSSREPSPNKTPTSPSRIPIKNNYKNVQAKVNSFNKIKPKVPPKPQVPLSKNSTKRNDKLERKESIGKFQNNGTSSRNSTNNNNTNISNNNSNNNSVLRKSDSNSSIHNKYNNNGNNTNINRSDNNNNSSRNDRVNNNGNGKTGTKYEVENEVSSSKNNSSPEKILKKVESVSKLTDLQPTTTTVVSTTTVTAAQPLKIDPKIEEIQRKLDEISGKGSGDSSIQFIDDAGKTLNATSVSSAMNKMNDTVLSTNTVIKDHNLGNLSSASSGVSHYNTNSATNFLPTIESVKSGTVLPNNHNNGFNTHKELRNNINKLISPDHTGIYAKSANERIKEARTVVGADVLPLKINVKEKPSNLELQSGNVRIPMNTSNGSISERPGLSPNNPPTNEPEEAPPANCCTRFLTSCRNKIFCCRKQSNQVPPQPHVQNEKPTGCFNCRKNKTTTAAPETTKWWHKLCCRTNKVGDTGCCPTGKRKDSWVDRRDSVINDPPKKESFLRKIFCLNKCSRWRKKPATDDAATRRESMLSKKKSLTSTATPAEVPEETIPKLDASLVEHTSPMKAAIPALPIPLAWFCLICNVFLPGIGTIFSGLFCLCIGKPRFSQKDGPRPRFGAFLIDLFIGCGQFFTVLFCLVGWGWSIWWGVIMLRVARKYRKLKMVEESVRTQAAAAVAPVMNQNHLTRDLERGS